MLVRLGGVKLCCLVFPLFPQFFERREPSISSPLVSFYQDSYPPVDVIRRNSQLVQRRQAMVSF